MSPVIQMGNVWGSKGFETRTCSGGEECALCLQNLSAREWRHGVTDAEEAAREGHA
jgi:hypothetical protein